ncbi:MAG: ABC transporter ATP-binding protein [Acidobacteria bacterium]|nr:ABC transporter ATP-binding protein [Acidobacteriota bacterium]
MPDPLLSVERLTTIFDAGSRSVVAANEVSFHIQRGETLGLVGESGSGKSVTAFSIIRLVQLPGRIAGGRVMFQGRDLVSLPEDEIRKVRGAGIGFIFQEPMAALNPVMRVGHHIAEALRVHGLAGGAEARARAIDLLRAVRIVDAERRVDDYPHQLSGGMRQRVMIAIALACRPPLVIADEPTTALDVTVQAQILDLLRDMKQEFGISLLLITHDLGVIAETADRVAIMYAGRIVEQGPVREIFRHPAHPYTRGLLESIPGGAAGSRLKAIDGAVPNLASLPPGCSFGPRCARHMPQCDRAFPDVTHVGIDHTVRCFLHSVTHRGGTAAAASEGGPRPAGPGA